MKKVKTNISLLFIVLIVHSIFATEQQKERLIYGSDTCLILETPLDSIFGNGRNKKFDIEKTSLWRGYVGTWQIRDSSLYLIEIEAKKGGKHLNFSDVFDGKKELEIKWYSGMLTIIGTTDYFPLNPYDKYANRIELIVKNGRVMNIQDIKKLDIEEFIKRNTSNKKKKEMKSAPKEKY